MKCPGLKLALMAAGHPYPIRFLSIGEYRRRLPHTHPEARSLPAKPNSDLTEYSTRGQAFVAQDRILDRHANGVAVAINHEIETPTMDAADLQLTTALAFPRLSALR